MTSLFDNLPISGFATSGATALPAALAPRGAASGEEWSNDNGATPRAAVEA